MNYTKGEWRVNPYDCLIIQNEDAWITTLRDTENAKANAHLISACPDMYEALKWWLEFSGVTLPDGEKPNRTDCIRITKQALAKAENK